MVNNLREKFHSVVWIKFYWSVLCPRFSWWPTISATQVSYWGISQKKGVRLLVSFEEMIGSGFDLIAYYDWNFHFFFTDFFVISMSLILSRLNLAARKDWFIQIKKIMQLYCGVQINCNSHKTSLQILLLIFSESEWINPVAFLKFLWNFKSFGSVNQLSQYYPASSCLFKFNDIVNFEYISLLVLVFLFLTLSR